MAGLRSGGCLLAGPVKWQTFDRNAYFTRSSP